MTDTIFRKKGNQNGLLILIVAILLILQIYSYLTSDWIILRGEYSFFATGTKIATTNFFTVVFKYIGLLILIFASLYSTRKGWLVYALVVLFYVLICCSVSLLSSFDVQTAIYSSSFPAIYLIVFAFFLGINNKFYYVFERLIRALFIIYLFLFALEFGISFYRFGWIVYSNSSVLNYYSHLFWSYACLCFIKFEKREKQKLIFIIILILGSVLIRSRSWLIQSLLLLLIMVFSNSKKGNVGAIASKVLLIILSILIAFLLISLIFPQYLSALVEKGLSDTRTSQYIEMFNSMEFVDWIIGKGEYATYQSSIYGEYSYIDNQFFNITFHYGILLAILLFWSFVFTLFCCIKFRKRLFSFLPCFGIVFLWFLSLNGLSVYNTITIDIKNFIMFYLIGHILSLCFKTNKLQ